MTTYFTGSLARPKLHEIDETRFEEIRVATKGIRAVSLIEERFSMLMEAYLDLEKATVAQTLEEAVRPDFAQLPVHELVHLFNRHLCALLSASRAYLDQCGKTIKATFGKGLQRAFAARSSFHYDRSLGYRLMDDMRNFSQHSGLPVSIVTAGNDLRNGYEVSFTYSLRVSEIRASRRPAAR